MRDRSADVGAFVSLLRCGVPSAGSKSQHGSANLSFRASTGLLCCSGHHASWQFSRRGPRCARCSPALRMCLTLRGPGPGLRAPQWVPQWVTKDGGHGGPNAPRRAPVRYAYSKSRAVLMRSRRGLLLPLRVRRGARHTEMPLVFRPPLTDEPDVVPGKLVASLNPPGLYLD
jgi:hypothetical protein